MTPNPATQRNERIRTLTEVSRALTYASSIEEILLLTVERAAELMGADKSLIMLTDADGLLVVRAAHGLDEERVRQLREPLAETLIERLQGLLGYPRQECFLSVPLVVQGDVTGLLAAVRADRDDADPATDVDDEWLLSALADQASVALENARLTELVRAQGGQAARLTEVHNRQQATLSHELRSPLTAIQSYSDLLLEGIYGPLTDPQREAVSRIRMAGYHLLSIIENVLDATRLAAGTPARAPVDVAVESVLAQALDMMRPHFLAKRQQLRATPAGNLVVRGDPNQLRQVLVNILSNANKYTPAGGVVEVVVSRREMGGRAAVAIAIRDTGRGIPDRALPNLFRPFDRAGAPASEPGLGLGLYISRELIRRMDGDIEVATRPGEGSTFTVQLPLAGSS